MSNSNDEISRLASQHRSKKERERELNKTNTPVAKDGTLKILRDTFSPKSDPNQMIKMMIAVFLVLALCWTPVLLLPVLKNQIMESAVGMLLFIGGSTALMVIVVTRSGRLTLYFTRRKLQKMKFDFDLNKYMRLMSQARLVGKLELQLKFSQSWNDNRQSEVVDAVKELVPEIKEVIWISSTDLTLGCDSDSGTGRAGGGKYGDSYSYFSNFSFHKRFMQIYKKVIPVLEGVAPIVKVEADIIGEVVSPLREI